MSNYIEWNKGLASKREVVVMAATLKIDRHEAAGRLMVFWEWCDENVPEENIDKLTNNAVIEMSPDRGDTEKFIDQIVCFKGFAKSMEKVGWLRHNRSSIVLPNYGRYNGSTAKSRNRNTKNQQKRRAGFVTNLSPESSDKKASNGTEHNGTLPLVSSLGKSAIKKDDWEFRIKWLKRAKSEHLMSDPAICFIHRNCHDENPSAIDSSEKTLLRIIGCAVHAMKDATDTKVGLFRWLVCNPGEAILDQDDFDRASYRLSQYRKQISENPSQFLETYRPLCDSIPCR